MLISVHTSASFQADDDEDNEDSAEDGSNDEVDESDLLDAAPEEGASEDVREIGWFTIQK